ncbi:aconitase X [Bradyrhizobium japonicum]|uniref:aconitase X n=1 Tax=Bradyrhizobium japonicum TaxID=375 RepID=UPI0004AD999B|nr:aconitase X catalytic domain-containing protein [Bradyrhizobium japonicum]
MQLSSTERRALDGGEGRAVQKAMELLIRYGEALGAERLVDTSNVAGVPGTSPGFLRPFYAHYSSPYEAVFSLFDLDSDEIVPVPPAQANTCHIQGGFDPELWREQGGTVEAYESAARDDAESARRGVKLLKTCTPHLAGSAPSRGEHCAWMESSAVIYCNSVIGARTNIEGKESTAAAMITGKIPYFGLHRPEERQPTHLVVPKVDVDSLMDWGLFGYYIGAAVGEGVPLVPGESLNPDALAHKHFGAAAACAGEIEMYHVSGNTPEAPIDFSFSDSLQISYGKEERRSAYERLNASAKDPNVDFVMLGCPHYTIEQIARVSSMLEGRRLNSGCRLWVFTSRVAKQQAERLGYARIIRDSGGLLMSDTCSAVGNVLPRGAKVAAFDSAKQTHYIPIVTGLQAHYGSLEQCVSAAINGRWQGGGI